MTTTTQKQTSTTISGDLSIQPVTAESQTGPLQEFKICIDMQSKQLVAEKIEIHMTDVDTGLVKTYPILRTDTLMKTTCPSLKASQKPHFKIMAKNFEVSFSRTL